MGRRSKPDEDPLPSSRLVGMMSLDDDAGFPRLASFQAAMLFVPETPPLGGAEDSRTVGAEECRVIGVLER